jgi:hypothetical protein
LSVENATRKRETARQLREEIDPSAALLGIAARAIAERRHVVGQGRRVGADRRTDRVAEVLPVEIATGRERTERTIPPGRWMD